VFFGQSGYRVGFPVPDRRKRIQTKNRFLHKVESPSNMIVVVVVVVVQKRTTTEEEEEA
jgi:hypothetical protein